MDNFDLKGKQKEMIAGYVKEARLAKGYTQQELSELSNISVRSIQRIENGEILPRNYTLKTLAGILGISFESMLPAAPESMLPAAPVSKPARKTNRAQKIILSVGIVLFVVLGSWAFIAQSPRFPETHFEFLTFAAFVFLGLTIILYFIWRTRS
jgi:transcriptional regulator with XRE-family HTH domain